MLSGFLRKVPISWSVAWILASTIAIVVHALEPTTPMGRLGRQAWTLENGLPQNTVQVLVQSHDGFLWIGTELGLARFDGVSFLVLDHGSNSVFPDAEVRCVLDSKTDGTLWIGTSDGIVRLKNDNRLLITPKNGLPGNSIRGMAQTSDGVIWVWTEAGLARLVHERFQAAPSEGLPGGTITSIAPDATGGLWLGTTSGVAVFRAGHWNRGPDSDGGHSTDQRTIDRRNDRTSLVKAALSGDVLISTGSGVFLEHAGALSEVVANTLLPSDGISFLDQLSNGVVAVASKSTVIMVQSTDSSGHAAGRFTVSRDLPGSRIESMYADREGCLWVGTNHGLARISSNNSGTHRGTVQRMPPTDPLASNAIVSLMEDREGDLWVGTETAGLQILRDALFRVIGTGDGLSSEATTAVVQDVRRSLWIGTREDGLNRVDAEEDGNLTIKTLTTRDGLLSDVILSLAVAPDGDLWIGTPDGLNRVARSGVSSYTSADGLPDDFIRSVLVAPDDSVWIGTRRGLTHFDHGRFQSYTESDGLGNNLVGALARAADGDLWIATLDGLSRFHNGRLSNYTTANGLSSNVITALDITHNGMIWIGTQNNGLNLWDGKRFIPVSARSSTGSQGSAGSLPTVIHGVIHDDRDHLWLATNSGLTRLDLAGLLSCTEQGACDLNKLHAATFTTADGLRSRETSSNSHPTACHGNDGQLWFTTPRGVIVVDPLHFPEFLSRPPIAIERFAVDDRDMAKAPIVPISAGALRFQFDYAGISFAAPQKVRYQYMLEGFDHAWTDAGTRRTAYYTNIPPAKYRFRVRAVLGDGVTPASSEGISQADETSLSFELMPRFYQTLWFRALMLLLIAALIVVVFRRRVLLVEREFRAVMGERNRIAREIHDTLAQGYVGISLQLEILGELLRHNRAEAASKHLAQTQDMVRDGLNDARQSIWALRSQDSGEQTLPIRLRRLIEQARHSSLSANLEVHGAYRALSRDAEQEVIRIAQEAIQNVKKHAEAANLSVRLDYDERSLALTVSDDGKGFEVISQVGASNGHYGLTGIRERASLINAEIEIVSEPGIGTAVKLKIPAPEARDKTDGLDQQDQRHSDRSKE